MYIGPCIIVIVEEQETNLMSLAILFHFFYVQHNSDINTSIIRSLRLFYCITTLVDQCGDTIENSQTPADGCINVRNMLSIQEVK